jgi:hypothetical protein
VLDERVHSAKLDGDVVGLVRDNLSECWALAHEREPVGTVSPQRPDA